VLSSVNDVPVKIAVYFNIPASVLKSCDTVTCVAVICITYVAETAKSKDPEAD